MSCITKTGGKQKLLLDVKCKTTVKNGKIKMTEQVEKIKFAV